ncbi:hypothetical protein [Diaphorobacter aerolatus]|uniref:Uncharacterized protein n=1 Tax=Diaphorobacter aerolatus TaxID=1288495 RepID=A0A7H0GIN7_9BURK|nr:hypothetical protein [Diaphorobacter aerolatus]QNP48153.1 hypothetical protein H9K75_19255 [Diaphorobacter aerolatus]
MKNQSENFLSKKKRLERSSTVSTDLPEMTNSPLPKDTLALGLAIAAELRLNTRGELLQRWMAHHLAETIEKAESATGTKKIKLERDAVNLILKLWSHRSALPEPIDPFRGAAQP